MHYREMYENVLLSYKDSLLRAGVWDGSPEPWRAGIDRRLGRFGLGARRGNCPLELKEGGEGQAALGFEGGDAGTFAASTLQASHPPPQR